MDKDQAIKFDLDEIVKTVIRKFPLVSDTFANVEFIESDRIKTAATDGKSILYNPTFMDTLSLNDQIFTIAHEGLHIAFEHFGRRENILDGSDGESKQNINQYKRLWNVATDAVINQALQAEGLTIRQGFVNIPEAFNQKADSVFFKLLEEYKKAQEDNKHKNKSYQSSQSNMSDNSNDQSTNSNNEDYDENDINNSSEEQSIEDWAKKLGDTCDDHDFWGNEHANNNEHDTNLDKVYGEELEEDFSKKNKQKKQEITKQVMQKIQEQKNKAKEFGNGTGNMESSFGEVGNAKSIYNWKKILNREFNGYIRQWSSRRATYENDYQSRIVSNYMYNKPRTEVILDTSASIDDELLKGFIRQLKPLLIDSQLFVGCFDTKFYEFTEIKSNKDITNFQVKGRGGTNLDIAVRSFTPDDKINKVIFTDGCGTMPKQDLAKTKRLFWIIFDNNKFEPCCGKVLYADADEIRREYIKLTQPTPEM